MSLPWDRWQPEPEVPEVPEVPEPELPYNPPANLPEIRELDFSRILKDAFVQAMNEVKEKPTSKGTDLVKADAKSRSWRTFVQGLIVDVLFAIIAAFAFLTHADPFVKETWIVFGLLLLKSVLSAIISYFMRLKVTPTMRTSGEKMAIMPVPRQMIDEEWKEKSA